MRGNQIYNELVRKQKSGQKSLAVLIDPDKTDHLAELLKSGHTASIDYFFVGGSLLREHESEKVIAAIRKVSSAPVILFPGNMMQLTPSADALLLLSLISGRNADMLIGRHVTAAPLIKASKLEVLPTGYMLIDSGKPTAVNYMSQTMPLPADKPELAACTALAGEQLGLHCIYLEAGSGAIQPVPVPLIKAVRQAISIPLIVGGGLTSALAIQERYEAGADLIVVGNVLETNPGLLTDFSQVIPAFAS
jgi:putative glycerol-1-phosphate prenyltransferase